MVYYAVIDTNVIISALLTKHDDASPLQIIRLMFRGDIIPLYNDEIIREYEEVLHRPKFHFSKENIMVMLEAIMTYGISVERLKTNARLVDLKDLVFYEVAMAKQEDGAYLVTGNKKHFPLETFVVTPTEMLDIINQ